MPVVVLFGALLCIAAAMLLIRRGYPLPHPPARCPACAYDLAGLVESDPCPECGATAASRVQARSQDRSVATLLQIPSILFAAGFAFPFVLGLVASESLPWAVGCLVVSLLPHAILMVIVGSHSSRLSPRAAAAITAGGLLGSTPVIVLVGITASPHKDALAGAALIFGAAISLLPMFLGVLIASFIIQMKWFKRWPASRTPA